MSQKFFITSSGTGVGKTLVTASLAYQLRTKGKTVSVIKPAITGYVDGDMGSDTAFLLQSMGLPVNPATVQTVSPWRFKAPFAPNISAAQEGREVVFDEVMKFCNQERASEITLIEGVGGVMAPLTDMHTMLDWMQALACPAIVVAGTYLGAISHALTAGEVLRARGIPVQAVVVSESAKSALSLQDTVTELKKFFPSANCIAPLPRVAGEEKLWERTADLTWALSW
ncbi:MAG: dethiobiotin synthase [Alphaproteobacteria bacterium]|nr:dethiobiotin synthase [Alphaproteobacteria bacterium]